MKLEGKNVGIRIMQLQCEPLVDEVKIVDGYEMWLEHSPYYRNVFGRDNDIVITSYYRPGGKRNVTSIHGYAVNDLGDGFKEVIFGIPNLEEVKEENGILLMVGVGIDVEADHRMKIAGRQKEGILELLPNDKIKVSRGKCKEELVAIKFEKQMYLIKGHRN